MSAFRSQLIHTCEIERYVKSRNSRGEVIPQYVSYLSAQPCRYAEKTEEFTDETQGLQIKTTWLLLLAPEVDIKPSDQIASVTVEEGEIITGPFVINNVIMRRLGKKKHHQSLTLEKIK